MNSKRVFFVMVGLIMLLSAGIIGGAYAGSQVLAGRAKKLTDLKLQNKVLDAEQLSLVKAKKDIAKYQPLETIAQTIVPQDKDQAESVREITNIAHAAGFSLSSITLPMSNLGAVSSSSSSSSASSGTSGSSSAAGNKKSDLTQLAPVKGYSGLYDLQITIAQDAGSAVPYNEFIDFLSRLEQNRRTAQVSSITLQPSSSDHNMVSFTLVLNEYIKP